MHTTWDQKVKWNKLHISLNILLLVEANHLFFVMKKWLWKTCIRMRMQIFWYYWDILYNFHEKNITYSSYFLKVTVCKALEERRKKKITLCRYNPANFHLTVNSVSTHCYCSLSLYFRFKNAYLHMGSIF